MVKGTARDCVWSFALGKALNRQSFELKHVRNSIHEPPSDRTIRDTLNTMVEFGWLEKEKKQSNEWQPGPATEKVELKHERYPVDPFWNPH